jgi:hypothetical protein
VGGAHCTPLINWRLKLFFSKSKEKKHSHLFEKNYESPDYFAPIDPCYTELLLLKRRFAKVGIELNLDPGGIEMQTIKPDANKGGIK